MTANPKRQFIDDPLPSSEGSERGVLGAILLDDRLLSVVAEDVKTSDFYNPFHRRVYAAMLSLFERSERIDAIMIGEELKRETSLNSVGGVGAISDLAYGLPMHTLRQSETIRDYAKTVASKRQVRDLIKTCNRIASAAAADDAGDDNEVILAAQAEINELCAKKTRGRFSTIHELAMASVDRARALRSGEVMSDGLASGFRRLDLVTGGFQKSDLVIIAGRPAMGKSSIAGQIAVSACVERPNAVIAIFSLEMSKEQYARRLLASMAEVDLQKVRTGNLSLEEMEELDQAAVRLSGLDIVVDDSSAIHALEIRAKLLQLRHQRGRLDGVIVDFLQRMTTAKKSESRQNEVSTIARDLKTLAKDLDVPVIALSSLSRECEKRNPPRPRMSDLRESGDIESEADLVAFVYRENYYSKAADPMMAELIIDKHRNGAVETIGLSFLREFARFKDAPRFSDSPS